MHQNIFHLSSSESLTSRSSTPDFEQNKLYGIPSINIDRVLPIDNSLYFVGQPNFSPRFGPKQIEIRYRPKHKKQKYTMEQKWNKFVKDATHKGFTEMTSSDSSQSSDDEIYIKGNSNKIIRF